ncbi:MAG: MBL fold metallo-hydrolase [Bryobacterales bacterium]|nr:MBL fold metallo-hydrolase [Bryobacterales bacterium]
MLQPLLRDDQFVADVQSGGEPRIWWLGQSGFLLRWRGRFVAFDPYLSDSLTRKYAGTDKPHVRMTERVVAPEKLDFVDVATSSHNHTDHLDAETLLAMRPKALLIPEANRDFVARRLGCDPAWPTGLSDGQPVELCGIRFHGIASAHEQVEPGFLGYVADLNGYHIYHPGDTVLYDGLIVKLSRFHIDLALLPINGSLPSRRVAGNLWGREAAWLAKEIGARLAVPCHYGMFEFNSVTPDEFQDECRRLDVHHRILQNGEGLNL